ncbi:hypothetical protein HYU13_02360 [Candidatus Woesearchaeota archaeon]|nr:hypothetical protein [Candidatus Woesearchaeota archaeon]
MNIENHLARLQEGLQVIQEAIEKGIEQRQRTIGFHASSACADMFEMLLHKKALIDPGFVVKHEWFKSKNKVAEKFPFTFPSKEEILSLIQAIEEKRDALCYGRPQKAEVIRQALEELNCLKTKIKEAGLDEI